jgi:hypothetical protein
MTAILCRIAEGSRPVVFIADTLKGETIEQWDGNKGTKRVPVSFYQTTEPASRGDAEVLRQQYAKATGQTPEGVMVRERLPRVFKERASILTGGSNDSPNPARANVQGATGGGSKKGSTARSEAARAQMQRDMGQTGETVSLTLNVPKADADTLRMLEDPRSAALILKIAETLKTAL